MVFFFTEKQQAEGINRVIIELLCTFLQETHIPHLKALGGLSSSFFFFFWNVKYGCNEHWVFHRRQLDSNSSFWEAHPFLFPCSAGSRVCSAAQTKHPPAQRYPAPHLSWSPLSTCTAVGAGLNHDLAIMGLTLNWFAQEQAGREQQLPEEAGCVSGTHRMPGCRIWVSQERLWQKADHCAQLSSMTSGEQLAFIRKRKLSTLSNPRDRQLGPRKGSCFVEVCQ